MQVSSNNLSADTSFLKLVEGVIQDGKQDALISQLDSIDVKEVDNLVRAVNSGAVVPTFGSANVTLVGLQALRKGKLLEEQVASLSHLAAVIKLFTADLMKLSSVQNSRLWLPPGKVDGYTHTYDGAELKSNHATQRYLFPFFGIQHRLDLQQKFMKILTREHRHVSELKFFTVTAPNLPLESIDPLLNRLRDVIKNITQGACVPFGLIQVHDFQQWVVPSYTMMNVWVKTLSVGKGITSRLWFGPITAKSIADELLHDRRPVQLIESQFSPFSEIADSFKTTEPGFFLHDSLFHPVRLSMSLPFHRNLLRVFLQATLLWNGNHDLDKLIEKLADGEWVFTESEFPFPFFTESDCWTCRLMAVVKNTTEGEVTRNVIGNFIKLISDNRTEMFDIFKIKVGACEMHLNLFDSIFSKMVPRTNLQIVPILTTVEK